MAKFQTYFDDDLIQQLEALNDFESLAKRLLKVAEPIIMAEFQRQLYNHRDTGALYSSLKPKIGKAKNGAYYLSVRPVGKDNKGERNMLKLMVLEFGKTGQAPKPVLTTTMKNVESRVLEAMRREWEKIVGE